MQTKREPQHHHELEKRSIIRKLTKEDLLISEAKAVAGQEISKETFKCHEKGKRKKVKKLLFLLWRRNRESTRNYITDDIGQKIIEKHIYTSEIKN